MNHVRISLALLALSLPLVAQVERERKPLSAEQDAQQKTPADLKPAESKPEDPLFKGMKYRIVGPFRGGRSLTASGIPGDPTTYYFGATGGGVWKSTDGAMTWTSVFDKEGTSSIGSLAVAPSDPNIVYVGTGEACLRGNISHGDGVYKTLDGGKTLEEHRPARLARHRQSHRQSRITPTSCSSRLSAIPSAPIPSAASSAPLDGGKTWEKVLYKDENTGGIDVAFDPHNANILFAALWQGAPHALESRQRRARQRALSLQRWRHHLEASRRKWPSKGTLWPHRRRRGREFRSRLCADRGRRRRPLSLRRWWRKLATRQRQPRLIAACLVLHAHHRRSAGSRHRLRRWTWTSTARPTAAAPSTRSRFRTATITACGLIRKTPAA